MTQAPGTTTRWRPTPDQLMILEELYMGGIKTPSAAQIRRITGHLSLYGKVECKNVFYWFQNHKAREKQKIRKRMLLGKQLQMQVPPPHHMQLQHCIMGENNHPNGVLYFIEPHYNCGLLHSQQGRCGSPQMSDNAWLRLYCTDNDDDAPMMISLTTHVGPTDSSPSSPPATTEDAVTASATAAIPPLKTLELFPTTASSAENHLVVTTNIIATGATATADTSLVLQML